MTGNETPETFRVDEPTLFDNLDATVVADATDGAADEWETIRHELKDMSDRDILMFIAERVVRLTDAVVIVGQQQQFTTNLAMAASQKFEAMMAKGPGAFFSGIMGMLPGGKKNG